MPAFYSNFPFPISRLSLSLENFLRPSLRNHVHSSPKLYPKKVDTNTKVNTCPFQKSLPTNG